MRRPWVRWATVFSSALFLGNVAHADDPTWFLAVQRLNTLFTMEAPFANMREPLAYFTLAFTALGYAAVMIATIRKVARARTGEESMGWVASLVMTVALMATAPAIGERVFHACDDLAAHSGYAGPDAIQTCANALLVIMPNSSPAGDVLDDAAAAHAPPPAGAPVQRDNGSWTKLAWTWMKMAWANMSDALGKIGAAFRAVINQSIVVLILAVPAVLLALGLILIQLGGVTREILHQSMDVFMPMMIAMLSFGPMRGPATNFITKYFAIALWPVAWTLGNAVSLSLLISVMHWVIETCENALAALHGVEPLIPAPAMGPLAAGYLPGAAALLPWGVLIIMALTISFCSTLLLVSAFVAPKALTATLTKGVCFTGGQIQEAVQLARAVAAQGGNVPLQIMQSGGSASATRSFISIAASRAGGSLSGAAAGMGNAAAAGGPVGIAAAGAAMLLSRAATLAVKVGGGVLDAATEPAPPSLNQGPSRQLSMASGSSSDSGRPNGAPALLSQRLSAVPRNFRRG